MRLCIHSLLLCIASILLVDASKFHRPSPGSGTAFLRGLRPVRHAPLENGVFKHHFEHVDNYGVNTTFSYKLRARENAVYLAHHMDSITDVTCSDDQSSMTVHFVNVLETRRFLGRASHTHGHHLIFLGRDGCLVAMKWSGGPRMARNPFFAVLL